MKKGDIMMVRADTGWGEGGMKKGDLVVVVEPGRATPRQRRVAQVLHPKLGVFYIRGCRLEAVNETR